MSRLVCMICFMVMEVVALPQLSMYGYNGGRPSATQLFQTFALSAGLYGCQIWATPYLSYTASCRTTAHANHVGFLKSLLVVKKATETHCVLRETGQMPLFFYWFRCTVRFWNCFLNTNNWLECESNVSL